LAKLAGMVEQVGLGDVPALGAILKGAVHGRVVVM
jgi:hypothetical protein